jgi:hypothetical protein
MSELRRISRSLSRAKVSPRRSHLNHPRLEELETRTLLSTTLLPAQLASSQVMNIPNVILDPPVTPGEAPLTPGEMRSAYGVNSIQFLSGSTLIKGTGAGQTIAIVDADNDPTIVADLATFDSVFGLANPPNFFVRNQTGGVITNQTGSPTSPRNSPHSSWSLEESLDVEWAHVMAPGANIVLFEANSASNANLATAVKTAATASTYTSMGIPAASVVSNSYGSLDTASAKTSDEAEDSSIYAPISNANQVSLVFSSGDNKAGDTGPEFPSTSPYVLGVGGTDVSLRVGPFGTSWSSEQTWNDEQFNNGSSIVDYGSSSGGTSAFETEPSYQLNYGISNSSGHREAPDVSMSASVESGVYITDSYDFSVARGLPATTLGTVFGTSLAAPMWGGLIAVTNQGRALAGEGPIGNVQEAVYAVPSSDFHDITVGTNGLTGSLFEAAGPGYDEVTGIGSPIANKLIPDLVAYNGTGPVSFTAAVDVDAGDQIDPNATEFINSDRVGGGEATPVTSTVDVTAGQVASVEMVLAPLSIAAKSLAPTQVSVAFAPTSQAERVDPTSVAATALPIPATSIVEGFHGSSDVLVGMTSDAVPVDFNAPTENVVVGTSSHIVEPTEVAAPIAQQSVAPAAVEKAVSVSNAVFADSDSVQALGARVETPSAVIAGDETHTVDLAALAGMALALGGSWSALAQAEETRKYPALRS